MHKEGVGAASNEVEVSGPAMDEWDPWNPPYPPYCHASPNLGLKAHAQLIDKWYDEINEIIATSRRTNTIIPDRTPQAVDDAFYDVLPRLLPILEKDSVRRFLKFFCQVGDSMEWGFIITPLTFTQMVKQNALQCAKVVLEGKAPELSGFCANPNYMNRYGYFPLHQAAEMFSVDMVKLLLCYGASANVRTAGAEVIEDLLPLHVAVENTCLHKYLEENAFPNQEDLEDSQANLKYICKLIHLLCLPEMKIFLDTTRLLAESTDNLFDELWNYIKDGKLVQTAVLLLAAQEQIRRGPSRKENGNSMQDGVSVMSPPKTNGNSKLDGFSIIINRIMTRKISLAVQTVQNRKKNKELEMEKKLTCAALLLVRAVIKAGDALDAYIQSHPEVPHNMKVSRNEVHERVSYILKDTGFYPPGESINVGNLCRYENVLSKKESPNNHGDMFAVEVGCQDSAKKFVRNGTPRGWELKYARRSFFPYWRSVLKARSPCKVIHLDDARSLEDLEKSCGKSADLGSSASLNPNLGLLGRAHGFSKHQPKRMFCSAALPLLKLFRNA
ncbi:hypothetical protein HU200_027211 [Digitaria exilis]|uniref:Uncharacterized protein n=1 Tax=Digitaria exilis TaxID=1010633 RepID=A0A835EV32_9POAL|nr:hypothetical protein HU200_027211 [Digitaria exilis]